MFTFSNEPQILSVFNFSPDTKEFIGESDAYIAPNTGLPRNCTQTPPPEIKQGFTPVWLGEEWQLVEDHRGQTFMINNPATKCILQNWDHFLKTSL